MPFVWVNEPQLPQTQIIEVPGPSTISYKVDVVANLVNAGGSLLYNTPSSQYDIIYQVDSLNVHTLTINTAHINTLVVSGSANIDNAFISNATFQNVIANTIYAEVSYGTNDPLTNLEIATKQYVDISVANVPSGGSELQNIIDAAGDLLVGVGPNTATRHPIGTTGQILIADSTTSTGLRWRSIVLTTATQSFSGLTLRNHPNKKLQNTIVQLERATEIIMDSGSRTYGWSNLSCNIDSSGAGGLDTGVKRNSQWYEIYAIHDSITGNKNLIFHQSTNIVKDAQFLPNTNASRPIRTVSDPRGIYAQSFESPNTGLLTSIELEVSRTGTPSGLMWATVQANSSSFPSGTPLSNSNFLLASEVPTDKTKVRFVFNDPITIAANTSYHLTIEADYSQSDSNYISVWGHSSNTYTLGYASEYRINFSSWVLSLDFGGVQSFWFKAFIQNIPSTAVILPSGYDEFCLCGYAYVDQVGKLKHFIQRDRTILTGMTAEWVSHVTETAFTEVADLTTTIPPRRGIGIYNIYRRPGTPPLPLSIGTLQAINLPAQVATGSGYVSSNTYGGSAGVSPGERVEYFPPIVIDNQSMMIRTQANNCKAYIVSFEF